MAQSIKHPTLHFCWDHDLRIKIQSHDHDLRAIIGGSIEMEPQVRLQGQQGVSLTFFLSLTLFPPPGSLSYK